jgi:hypothetical protein
MFNLYNRVEKFTLYLSFNANTAGKFTIVPSIEYRPSTMTMIFFHGLCVFGWPCAITSLSRVSSAFISLCLNILTLAPLNLTPTRMLAWLSSSLMTKHPLPTRAGMIVLLVANPMDMIVAASTPTNLATNASVSSWRSIVPPLNRAPPLPTPYRLRLSSTTSAHPPLAWAKPR